MNILNSIKCEQLHVNPSGCVKCSQIIFPNTCSDSVITTFPFKVYICHNNPTMTSPLPGNVEQCKGIVSFVGSNAFSLSDGATIDGVDCLVFCTGYNLLT